MYILIGIKALCVKKAFASYSIVSVSRGCRCWTMPISIDPGYLSRA